MAHSPLTTALVTDPSTDLTTDLTARAASTGAARLEPPPPTR